MKHFALIALLTILATPAFAIDLAPDSVSGDFTFRATAGDETAISEVCFFRVDTGEEIGCDSEPEEYTTASGTFYPAVYSVQTVIERVSGITVKARAKNVAGFSDDSADSFTLYFFPPPPVLVPR